MIEEAFKGCRILITGGAGYVGSRLVPQLLSRGFAIRVLDLFLFCDTPDPASSLPELEFVRGDIRDHEVVAKALVGCEMVIHLACISNDPSFELNPALGKEINFTAFQPLVQAAKASGVRRFIFASSASVYGVKQEEEVTEELCLEPLTDYSRYKALCEETLLQEQSSEFTVVVIRPATICGFAPRLRLDLTVNIFANQAYHDRNITIFGGSQQRPNIHIDDVCDLYALLLSAPSPIVNGRVFNVGATNHSIDEIAGIVREIVGPDVTLQSVPTLDLRSYRISSTRIAKELGYRPKRDIADAVRDLIAAFSSGAVPNAKFSTFYYNVRRLQEIGLH